MQHKVHIHRRSFMAQYLTLETTKYCTASSLLINNNTTNDDTIMCCTILQLTTTTTTISVLVKINFCSAQMHACT